MLPYKMLDKYLKNESNSKIFGYYVDIDTLKIVLDHFVRTTDFKLKYQWFNGLNKIIVKFLGFD